VFCNNHLFVWKTVKSQRESLVKTGHFMHSFLSLIFRRFYQKWYFCVIVLVNFVEINWNFWCFLVGFGCFSLFLIFCPLGFRQQYF
jgi:hypothetical protein